MKIAKKIVMEERVRVRFFIHFARVGVFPLTLKNDLSENENTVGWPFIS